MQRQRGWRQGTTARPPTQRPGQGPAAPAAAPGAQAAGGGRGRRGSSAPAAGRQRQRRRSAACVGSSSSGAAAAAAAAAAAGRHRVRARGLCAAAGPAEPHRPGAAAGARRRLPLRGLQPARVPGALACSMSERGCARCSQGHGSAAALLMAAAMCQPVGCCGAPRRITCIELAAQQRRLVLPAPTAACRHPAAAAARRRRPRAARRCSGATSRRATSWRCAGLAWAPVRQRSWGATRHQRR